MKNASDFAEFLVGNPEVLADFQRMSPTEMFQKIKDMGYALSEEELIEVLSQSEEGNDVLLASTVSGGSCAGHCGRTCEQDRIEPCRPESV